ncbi:hypothetical protein B7R56_21675 [Pseudomonas savastanoi pv. retacarpa]|nr:hypothetical protein B7R56_21675 [Pseudomonas savastanoi pv. retacarpa]
MWRPGLRRDRLNFGYDNRFQNPTICSRRLPCSSFRPNIFFSENSLIKNIYGQYPKWPTNYRLMDRTGQAKLLLGITK